MYLVGVQGRGVEDCPYQDVKMELASHLSRVVWPETGSQPGAASETTNPTSSAQSSRAECNPDQES